MRGSNNFICFGRNCSLTGGLVAISGNSNSIKLGNSCLVSPNVNLIFNGNDNVLEAKSNIQFLPGSLMEFQKDHNQAYLGPDTKVSSSTKIKFLNNNSLLYTCGSCTLSLAGTSFRSNSILFYGFGGGVVTRSCLLREGKNIIIGSDCMFSYNINFINATGHAIYDGNTKDRISKGQSIIIGDHVWVGCGVSFIKGSIGSGAMIGANSHVVSNIPAGCLAAGHPAKSIRDNILWTSEGPGDGEVENLSYFESYQAPLKELKPIGWQRLLKIDKISLSVNAKEKIKLIQQILNE